MANKTQHKISRIRLVILVGGLVLFFLLASLAIILINTKFLSQNTFNKLTDNAGTVETVQRTKLTDNINNNSLITSIIDNFNLDYDISPYPQKANTIRIPVLTYHQIENLPNSNSRDYYVSPSMFDEQMKYLSEKNYKVLTPKEFYDIMQTGKNPKQKSVMLTFDDGNKNNYINAYPILLKYGFPGVFYVPSHKRGISNSQLIEMSNHGMVIDPHGKTHMMLSKITDAETLYQEIVVSKASLQSVTGKTSNSFCYPGCEYNGSVTSTIASSGYLLAFTCGENSDHKIGNRFTLTRMHVYNDMQHYKTMLSGHWYYPAGY